MSSRGNGLTFVDVAYISAPAFAPEAGPSISRIMTWHWFAGVLTTLLQVLALLRAMSPDGISYLDSAQLRAHGVEPLTCTAILDAVRAEASQLRLGLCGGFPWETVATELRLLRIHHSDASPGQWLFSRARLLPAAVLPPRAYYRWRTMLTRNSAYLRLRDRYLPIPMGDHLSREDKGVPREARK